eukprot:jgi/Phyca11/119369/e_gw1.38.417.1
MYSVDIKWRGVVLLYVYNIDVATVASVLGVSERSLSRWYHDFKRTGNVLAEKTRNRSSRWPDHVCSFAREYVNAHPYSTICRALRFDLGLTRKVLTKRAKETVARERQEYINRLLPFYSGPDQLVFVDETSKDGR